MCAFIFTLSPPQNLCTTCLCCIQPEQYLHFFLHAPTTKSVSRERQNLLFQKQSVERKQNFRLSFCGGFWTDRFFLFFCHRGFPKRTNLRRGNEERVSFFLSHTHHRIVTFRIEILFDFNDTHINTRITQHVRCFL